ncbi:uncharacterized protein EDB93DRAFT_1331117 [Suillus bovinus]|uniref:uncharacterized protein n=1 Tax=Suillus bovinus TaxID=48563 RepID=UPI001B8827FA|nr:uncharacterized protein EDB93DRAFT_1331117 [Suillus bovinus]KAG2135407.1 hypothetical protein EDB93DRAFT_1331117 [Suillus bovinus]
MPVPVPLEPANEGEMESGDEVGDGAEDDLVDTFCQQLDTRTFQERMLTHVKIRDFCDGLEYQIQFNDYRMLTVLERNGSSFLRLADNCLSRERRENSSRSRSPTTWEKGPPAQCFIVLVQPLNPSSLVQQFLVSAVIINAISLSPNERILAGTPLVGKTAYLWNLETDQLMKTPDHPENFAQPTFSADGKFLVTSCEDGHLYTWDVSAIVKEAGLPVDILDAPPQPAVKKERCFSYTPRVFDDDIRKANEHIRLSQSHGPYHHPTPAPRQRTFSRFPSLWHDSNLHGETEHRTRPQSHPLSWTRKLVSSILNRRDGLDIQLQEVEVPYTAGKPRNHHARKKKPTTSSSQPSNTHTTQQPSTSSQQPPPTAAASTLSAVTGTTGATGTPSHPHITNIRWSTRFVAWIAAHLFRTQTVTISQATFWLLYSVRVFCCFIYS